MHGVFVKAMSNHPILLSGVQWSGVHVSSVNECVAVLAVCEAPQGHLVCTVMQISMIVLFLYLRFLISVTQG